MNFIFFFVILASAPSLAQAELSPQVGNLTASYAANEVLQGFRNGNPFCKKIENLIPQGANPKLQAFSLSGTWTNLGTVTSVLHSSGGGWGGGGYAGLSGDQ